MEANVPYYDLLENLFDGVYYVDKNQKITFWNAAAERITGFGKDDVLGRSCSENILRHIDSAGCEVCLEGCPLHLTLVDGKNREASLLLHHKKGHRVPVHIRIAPILDDSGDVIGGVEIFSENSEERTLIHELQETRKENLVDPLLQIGNRRYAEMVFQTRLYELKAYQIPFSVVMIDLDDFKEINDSYGHNIGDKVLKMVTESLSSTLRGLDAIIRWGGDEIVLLNPNITKTGLIELLARTRIYIEKSFLMIEGKKVSVTASMGGTIARVDDTLANIIDRVDRLMYQSKQNGKNQFIVD